MQSALIQLTCVVAAVTASSEADPTIAHSLLAPTAVQREGSKDMNFGLGKWHTEITSFRDPFNHPDDATHMSGTKIARPIWGGKAVIEEIEAEGPSGHWEAANLYLYDPNAHQWSQSYVDSSDGHFDPPSVGKYRDRNLEFYWQAMIAGRATLERGIWSKIRANSHTYEVARSIDGGRTWHTSFIAHLTRIQ